MDTLTGLMRVKSFTSVSAGAGNTMVDIKPDAGKLWKIYTAWFYHAAGAARNSGWTWFDPESPAGVLFSGTVALATGTPLHIGALAALGLDGVGYSFLTEPPWASQYSYPSALWTATAGGENGYVFALVMEQAGMSKIG